mgnify:CR=1 FL=1
MADQQSPAPAPTKPQTIKLADYRPPAFLIDSVDLVFDLGVKETRVTSRLAFRRNPKAGERARHLVLNGSALTLENLELDGETVSANSYTIEDEDLSLDVGDRDAGVLDITTRIHPDQNTALDGLYTSNGDFFTQCEPEGFRRITYYPDRPDVLSVFTVTMLADKARYPVLLSNGNPVDSGEAAGGRHWVKWHDPFRKPSYLFALVAGDLDMLRDSFTTRSGREVDLRIYARGDDVEKVGYAMQSLKASMKWDEDVFGLEYDLDRFNIVAVGDFNMGAMENKSLNIFNTALLLARPETATDADYNRIESVVGHEYFHNWTGNRITCRDWFQLTLKEGLTVFRDQQFSADMNSAAVQRISDVRRLRAAQFPEDAGPTAHPIRPESYIEINNFYTATVYEKGAEVIRMIHTLIGAQAFRRGMDLYVERFDGQAVTCEDFVTAMEDASGMDLGRFRLWYAQAGTPRLEVTDRYDAAERTLHLSMWQTVPATPGQRRKQPMPIPVAVGLLDAETGEPLAFRLPGEDAASTETHVLLLEGEEASFTLHDVERPAIPSLLRNFSAPVVLARPPVERLSFLYANDVDPFARWEAGQQLATAQLLDMIASVRKGEAPVLPASFADAFAATLHAEALEPALKAEALTLPGEAYLADQMKVVDVEAIHTARDEARATLGEALRDQLLAAFEAHAVTEPYAPVAGQTGRRALRCVCLALLAAGSAEDTVDLLMRQFRDGGNMTDVLGALGILSHIDRPERQQALDAFYERWQGDDLVIDKWFALQAMSSLPGTVRRVRELRAHPAFRLNVPNRVRALVASFAFNNQLHFHSADGSGYSFLADTVLELDPVNPQIAARILAPMGRWRRMDEARQALMKRELERILDRPGLSKDVFEIASKGLAA